MARLPRLLLVALSILTNVALTRAASAPPPPKVGDMMHLQFIDTAGNDIELSNYRGRIVIVHFWSPANQPSMDQADSLVQIEHRYAGKGIALIGIDMDHDAAQMRKAATASGFDWPQY